MARKKAAVAVQEEVREAQDTRQDAVEVETVEAGGDRASEGQRERVLPIDEYRGEGGVLYVRRGSRWSRAEGSVEVRGGGREIAGRFRLVPARAPEERAATVQEGMAVRAQLERMRAVGQPLELTVTGVEQTDFGQVLVCHLADGWRVMIPRDEIDLPPEGWRVGAKVFLGQPVQAIIQEIHPDMRAAKGSRRAARAWLAERTRERLAPGSIHTAQVVAVRANSAYLDLRGVNAVLPAGEYSHSYTTDLRERLRGGEELQVKVKSFNGDGACVVSVRDLRPDPWDTVGDRYREQGTYIARVTGWGQGGAPVFVEMEQEVEAIAPPPPWRLSVGLPVVVRVTRVDVKKRHMRVSIHEPLAAPRVVR